MIFNTKSKYFLYLILSLFIISCSSSDNDGPVDEQPEEVSPVIFDINAVPYTKLSEYNFFKGTISDLEPVYGVLPFQPASQLFTDYASKKRFIWMPDGASGNYVSDNKVINFPNGTVLIKNFYYENVLPSNTKKIIETRLMIKKPEGWIFANYIWNEEQTEATYNETGGFLNGLEFVHNGQTKTANYRIPSKSECTTCHSNNEAIVPIGPKPQNLNFAINFADGNKNQLQKLKDFGYINNEIPANIVSTVDYTDTSKSLDLRARSYLDINCTHCHTQGGFSQTYPVKYDFTQTPNYYDLGFCQETNFMLNFFPEGVNKIIYPGDHLQSIIHYRMAATHGPIVMPYIGRSIVHEEGVNLVDNWINSFLEGCE